MTDRLIRSSARLWLFAVLLMLGFAPSSVFAQPTPDPPAPPTPTPTPATPDPPAPAPVPAPAPGATPPPAGEDPASTASAEDKKKALLQFKMGLRLLQSKAWGPALAAFKQSRELYPTRVATHNAAVALYRLQRYDEALSMFEELMRNFTLPDDEKEAAGARISELRSLVGTINIVGAEIGAAIVVDSEDRGKFPLLDPIRVPSGIHTISLEKEGYRPFKTSIDLAGGVTATVEAKLQKLDRTGRLKVLERGGKKMEVVVDSFVKGETPWEGLLEVGIHTVQLKHKTDLQLGTQPTQVEVKKDTVSTVNLVAERLDAQLHVKPLPPGATVYVNQVDVGTGIWLGRLKAGKHKVSVKMLGFVTQDRTVTLKKGQREIVEIDLERDEDADIWKIPPKWTFDLDMSFLLVPTFGGQVASGCAASCQSSLGIGGLGMLHASYELGSGLGFGLEGGYLIATQSFEGRDAALVPVGFDSLGSEGLNPQTTGTSSDSLRLQGFLAGLAVGYHMGEDFPLTFRLGAGVMYGEFRNERAGTYNPQLGEGSFDAYAVADFPSATYFYLDPGVRAGITLTKGLELSLSVKALLLIGIIPPKWNNTIQVAAGQDGIATYPNDDLMGSFVAAIAPGLNLRYHFGPERPPLPPGLLGVGIDRDGNVKKDDDKEKKPSTATETTDTASR